MKRITNKYGAVEYERMPHDAMNPSFGHVHEARVFDMHGRHTATIRCHNSEMLFKLVTACMNEGTRMAEFMDFRCAFGLA